MNQAQPIIVVDVRSQVASRLELARLPPNDPISEAIRHLVMQFEKVPRA